MRQSKLIISAFFLISPFAVNADLIRYEVTGNLPTTDWTMMGFVLLDEQDVIADVNFIDKFLDWGFSWTDGNDTFSVTSAKTTINRERSLGFRIDALGEVVQADITVCNEPCSWAQHPQNPVFAVLGNLNFQGNWYGTISTTNTTISDVDEEVSSFALWSAPIRIVPEPSTLALLGIGLAGMGLARRKKKA